MSGAGSTLDSIGQIMIPTHDLDRAVAFYRDILSLPFLFKAPPGLAFLNCGGVRLLLEHQPAMQSSIVYFRVGDINAAYARLVAAGVVFDGKPHLLAKMPDHDLWMAFFRDSEENLMALMCEVRA